MEKFVKWDREKIDAFIRKCSNSVGVSSEIEVIVCKNETLSKEDAVEILTMLNSILSNKETFEKEIPKRQLKIVTNFDQETLDLIRPYFEDPYVHVMGHGTLSEDLAQSIIKEGLKADSPWLGTSFIGLDYDKDSFESIKHWEHKNCKYIVLAAFNDVRVMPIWKELEEKTANLHNANLLDKSRIIGYIDVENQRFIKSPYYKKIQTINPEFNKYEDGRVMGNLHVGSASEIILKIRKLMFWGTMYCDTEHSDFLRENVYDAIMYQINDLAKKLELQVDNLKTREEIEQEKKDIASKFMKNDGVKETPETTDWTQSFDGEGWGTFDDSEWDDGIEQSNQKISSGTQDLFDESHELTNQIDNTNLSTLTSEQVSELQKLGYIGTPEDELSHSKK